MNELIRQALILTGWGMGMTFLAIGALVLGMFLMTILIKDRQSSNSENFMEYDSELDISLPESDESAVLENELDIAAHEIDMAAVAAVTVAIAIVQQPPFQLPKLVEKTGTSDGWDHYVRGRRMSQRSQYELRRFHKLL
ncbi:MAG: hypothetical protein P1S60_09310 [Anaerolineae bacterium]|nr:hypothetical protein [Anaerolineae bacterium]